MKLRILVAATATLSLHAHAQTGVTVYGSFDGGVRHETNVDRDGNDLTRISSNGTYRPNRLGFRGSEDLGDDLKANFVLELGFNSGTGALNNTNNVLFQREAHVGIGNKYLSLDIGRNYSAAYRAIQAFDPFKFRYPSITYTLSSTNGIRKDNDVQLTGRYGDWTARLEWAPGEIAGDSNAGTTKALALNYARGGLKAGASYSFGKQNAGTTAAPLYRDYDHKAYGASYDFGAFAVAAGHVEQEQETASRAGTSKWDWVGGSYQLTNNMDFTLAWYRNKVYTARATAAAAVGDGQKDLLIAGISYDLSKRTTLYAEIDRTRLRGGLASGGTERLNQTRQSGIAAGILHAF